MKNSSVTINVSCPCPSTNHHAMKAYWGMEVYLHAFLTSALVVGEWLAPRPDRFTPGKEHLVPIGWEAGWNSEPVWTRL